MAKKAASEESTHRIRNDIVGLVLLCASIILLIALFSYDSHDLSVNSTSANAHIHNAIGPFGAWVAFLALEIIGVAAYVFPFLLLIVGLGCFWERMAYMRSRWAWTGVLLLCIMGVADLFYGKHENILNHKLQLQEIPGGMLGAILNQYIFSNFGTTGAAILFFLLIFISILFLTNFHLAGWLNAMTGKFAKTDEPVDDAVTPAPKSEKVAALEQRKQELERQLQQSVAKDRPDLGADGKPIPAPMVRDLSVPQPKVSNSKSKKETASSPEPVEIQDAIIIPASEVAAATAADILGKNGKYSSAKDSENGEKKSEGDTAPGVEPSIESPAIPIVSTPGSKPKSLKQKPKPIVVASTPMIGNYKLPPMDFLQHPDTTIKPTETKEDLMANARLMQQTLAQFDISVSLGDITKGPTITRYELHPAPGVKLEKISALNNNISAALKAERINILAPVPGKSSVGVEVPNLVKTKVIMRDLLESEEWINSKARIPLALGKDVYGLPIIADLAEMPHLLIAGSTGSGKSVCINSIIASLLYKFSPDQLRFVMIDPKVVEMQQYNTLPHLVVPVVTDPNKVILALRWVINEMEKRYQIFAKVGVRNIKSFNERPKTKLAPAPQQELLLTARKEKVEPGSDGFAVEVDEEIVVPRDEDIVIPEKLSYIVVIIDELADLMLVAPKDVESAIARITQMARAAGIHCIVATQRPSVDVITGVIKANIPARIAFQVAAKVDSRTILDAMGADKLLGKGDMLYLPPGSARLIRAQGALITDQEIQQVVDFIAVQGKPSYEVDIHQQLSKPSASFDSESDCDEDEDLIEQCIEVIRTEQKASVSLMQRRLRLGYTRAARIMDELERRGIVGPSKGAEPRDILIDLDGEGADGGGQSAV